MPRPKSQRRQPLADFIREHDPRVGDVLASDLWKSGERIVRSVHPLAIVLSVPNLQTRKRTNLSFETVPRDTRVVRRAADAKKPPAPQPGAATLATPPPKRATAAAPAAQGVR